MSDQLTPAEKSCENDGPETSSLPRADAPSYCVFDGLQWTSKRGLGRFATQLGKHLERMSWNRLSFSRPRWGSPIGRVLLTEFVEPFWREALAPEIAFFPHNILPSVFLTHRSFRVLVLHDILFLQADNMSNPGNQYRRFKLNHSVAQADLIITVSEFSRSQILKLLHRNTEVLVIPNALPDGFEAVQRFSKLDGPRPTKVLHFGGHAPTKNTKAVLRAVALLNERGAETHLVLAAMSGQLKLVEEWRQETQLTSAALTVLPSLSDEALRQVYAESDVHCMPSTGEGFGIPVIEAARCRIPNVLSPLPVFRELLGDHAIFADSLSAESIAEAIRKCMNSDLQEQTACARARSERFLFESVHRRDAVGALERIKDLAASRRTRRYSQRIA